MVPALVAHWTLRPASVSLATFQNHLHALHPGETPLEVRVESRVVGRTTMSNSASGNDRDGMDSRNCSMWVAQMPWVSAGFSNGSIIPR